MASVRWATEPVVLEGVVGGCRCPAAYCGAGDQPIGTEGAFTAVTVPLLFSSQTGWVPSYRK